MSIWVCRRSQMGCPPQCGRVSFNPSRVWIDQRGQGRENLPSLYLNPWAKILTSCPWIRTYTIGTPGSPVFRLGLELHHWLSWVSCLQKTVQVTFIYLSITYWFCSSEEPWLIQMGTWQRKYHWLSWVEKKKVKKLSWNFGKALVNLTKKTEATLSVYTEGI